MKFQLKAVLFGAGLLAALAAQAQQLPADAPAGTTVQCKDGSYASPDTKSGACRGHKGIKTWYGKADAKTGTAAAAPAAAPAAPAAPAAAAPAAPAAAPAAKAPAASDPSKMAAAPGGEIGRAHVCTPVTE